MCPNDTGDAGLCAIDLACTGTTNRTCDSGSLCCFNGCSRVCTTGVIPSPLCSAVKLKATNSSSGLLGAYIPQCEENGDFSEIQCHEGYCWCVDVKTGKATTQPARTHPVCNATTSTPGKYMYMYAAIFTSMLHVHVHVHKYIYNAGM